MRVNLHTHLSKITYNRLQCDVIYAAHKNKEYLTRSHTGTGTYWMNDGSALQINMKMRFVAFVSASGEKITLWEQK